MNPKGVQIIAQSWNQTQFFSVHNKTDSISFSSTISSMVMVALSQVQSQVTMTTMRPKPKPVTLAAQTDGSLDDIIWYVGILVFLIVVPLLVSCWCCLREWGGCSVSVFDSPPVIPEKEEEHDSTGGMVDSRIQKRAKCMQLQRQQVQELYEISRQCPPPQQETLKETILQIKQIQSGNFWDPDGQLSALGLPCSIQSQIQVSNDSDPCSSRCSFCKRKRSWGSCKTVTFSPSLSHRIIDIDETLTPPPLPKLDSLECNVQDERFLEQHPLFPCSLCQDDKFTQSSQEHEHSQNLKKLSGDVNRTWSDNKCSKYSCKFNSSYCERLQEVLVMDTLQTNHKTNTVAKDVRRSC